MNQFGYALDMIRAQTTTLPSNGFQRCNRGVLEGAFRAMLLMPPIAQVRLCLAVMNAHMETLSARVSPDASMGWRILDAVGRLVLNESVTDFAMLVEPLFHEAWGGYDGYKLPFANLLYACIWCQKADRRLTAAYCASALDALVEQQMTTVFKADDPIGADAFQKCAAWNAESHDDEMPPEMLRIRDISKVRPITDNLPAQAVWLREWRQIAGALSSISPEDLLSPMPVDVDDLVGRWKQNNMQPGRPMDEAGRLIDW